MTDVANALVDMELPVPAYGTISKIPTTGTPPSHTRYRLTHIDYYIGDVISTVQGGPELQHRVFDGTVCALKWILPSLPRESKYLVIFKKLLVGEGDWACSEEVL